VAEHAWLAAVVVTAFLWVLHVRSPVGLDFGLFGGALFALDIRPRPRDPRPARRARPAHADDGRLVGQFRASTARSSRWYPACTASVLQRLIERWLPRNIFVFIFGNGLFVTLIVFCVPGESYLAVLDALHDVRESSARRLPPGRRRRQHGRGLRQAHRRARHLLRHARPRRHQRAIGVHTAFQDSTPMILFIGQVGTDFVEREAFQEIDYRRMFGQMAKWVAQIDRAERIPEYVSRAFHTATAGRPGPVVLALPEDMLTEAPPCRHRPLQTVRRGAIPAATWRALQSAAGAAERPARDPRRRRLDAQAARLPRLRSSAAGCRSGLLVPPPGPLRQPHPNYAGDVGIGINPKLAERVKEADLLLAIGARLGEMTTGGYTLFDVPVPAQKLVHVHPAPRSWAASTRRRCRSTPACRVRRGARAAGAGRRRARWKRADAKARGRTISRWQRAPADARASSSTARSCWLRERLPARRDRHQRRRQLRRLGAPLLPLHGLSHPARPTNGAMGYGVPAAIAAKLVHPERTVVALRRRRRLPDERPGARDRRAVRRAR
jgi:acetolactate synthase I/II/III large subunit